MRYCFECGHYVQGGVEHNCLNGSKVNDKSVCAIKEACGDFIEREEQEQMVFKPIRMRKLKKKRR